MYMSYILDFKRKERESKLEVLTMPAKSPWNT